MTELTVLGLESSCDETAAGIVRGRIGQPGDVLANAVFDQTELHKGFGGVVPEIAARAHAERADLVVQRALKDAGLRFADLDAIAVTAGPGLIGGVIAGHALTPRLSHGIVYPYLLLLASGGHCQFLSVSDLGQYCRLGGTIDDAPGEAFDKVAKMLGLGFPGGPVVEKRARSGDPARFNLPRPLLDRPGCDMSFSGLKTAVVRAKDRLISSQGGLYQHDVDDLCAAFQAATCDVLAEKSRRALSRFRTEHPGLSNPVLAVAGGVAANQSLRAALECTAGREGALVVAPPLDLCTDNGAMIAWAGLERLAAGLTGGDPTPRPRWPLDQDAAPLLGSGKRGAKA